MRASAKVDYGDLVRAAVAGGVDVRTLQKAIRGSAVSSSSLKRIRRGLRARGLLGLLPEAEVGLARAEAKVAAAERRTVRQLERLAAIAAAAGTSPFAAELVRLAEQRAAASKPDSDTREGSV